MKQECVNSFLDTARQLQVHGLVEQEWTQKDMLGVVKQEQMVEQEMGQKVLEQEQKVQEMVKLKQENGLMMSKECKIENNTGSQYEQFQKNTTENVSQNKYFHNTNLQSYSEELSETGVSFMKTPELQESFKQGQNVVYKWASPGEKQTKFEDKKIFFKNPIGTKQ